MKSDKKVTPVTFLFLYLTVASMLKSDTEHKLHSFLFFSPVIRGCISLIDKNFTCSLFLLPCYLCRTDSAIVVPHFERIYTFGYFFFEYTEFRAIFTLRDIVDLEALYLFLLIKFERKYVDKMFDIFHTIEVFVDIYVAVFDREVRDMSGILR